MKVSHNELSGLCRRAFEGLGFPAGDHEDAADMVVWLEQHGLGGMEALQDGLAHLSDRGTQPLSRTFEDSSLAVIDACGNSILVCGSLAADLVYTRARRKGLAVVKIHNCYNRKLMLGYLARCARRGVSMMAFWRNTQAPVAVEQVVSIRAYEEYPTLLLYQVEDRDERLTRNHSVTLIASPHFAMLQTLHPDPEEATLLQVLGPEDFERQSRRVWQEGMEVGEAAWKQLKDLSSLTLVEESEESRNRGAGEQAK